METESKQKYLQAKAKAKKMSKPLYLSYFGINALLLYLTSLQIMFGYMFVLVLIAGGFFLYMYRLNKGGSMMLYGKYIGEVVNQLALDEKIVLLDKAENGYQKEEIGKLFHNEEKFVVSVGSFFIIKINEVKLNAVQIRVVDQDLQDIAPVFVGTAIKIKESNLNDVIISKETNIEDLDDYQYLQDIKTYFSEDVLILKEGEYLYLGIKEQLKMNHYFEVRNRSLQLLPVVYYDDVDEVIESWRKYKEIKELLIK